MALSKNSSSLRFGPVRLMKLKSVRFSVPSLITLPAASVIEYVNFMCGAKTSFITRTCSLDGALGR